MGVGFLIVACYISDNMLEPVPPVESLMVATPEEGVLSKGFCLSGDGA